MREQTPSIRVAQKGALAYLNCIELLEEEI